MDRVKNNFTNLSGTKPLIFTKRKDSDGDYTHNVRAGNFSEFFYMLPTRIKSMFLKKRHAKQTRSRGMYLQKLN